MKNETPSQTIIRADKVAPLEKQGKNSVFDLPTLIIEENIPMPEAGAVRTSGGGVYGPTLALLEIKDSFRTEKENRAAVKSAIRAFTRQTGKIFSIRVDPKSVAHIRIWRIS